MGWDFSDVVIFELTSGELVRGGNDLVRGRYD